MFWCSFQHFRTPGYIGARSVTTAILLDAADDGELIKILSYLSYIGLSLSFAAVSRLKVQ